MKFPNFVVLKAMLMKYNYLYIVAFIFLFAFLNSANAQSRILNFDAIQYKNSIQLNYTIAPGDYCVGYDILRSDNAVNFYVIYNYPSVCGDGIKAQNITYYDTNPLKNIVSYYQIFIPPNSYSNVVSVNYWESFENGYILFSNPINNELKIHTGFGYSTLEIYDIKGNKTLELKANEEGLIEENVNNIPNGLYFFIIKTNNIRLLKGRFLKQQ